MKKNTLLYVPLLVLFVFAAAVLITHYAGVSDRYSIVSGDFRIPFSLDGTAVSYSSPIALQEGLEPKDKIISINGRAADSDRVFFEEFAEAKKGRQLAMTVERQSTAGGTETRSVFITPVKIETDLNFYLRLIVGFIFSFILPTFCILLGFYVVIVRPRDYLAWLLLFVLFGVSSIGLEGHSSRTVIGAFRQIFGSSWALSMLLFGIYFPERLNLDKKWPWLKYLFIIPLGFQIVHTILGQLKLFTGFVAIDYLQSANKFFDPISTVLNMLAIGLFFASLGWKSGTLENPDAGRRLRLMVIGTSVAMTPAFLIIAFSVLTGARGSFFDIAPSWLALLALLLLLLFPATMAFVIVVQRAMDVSVVVRQGLQYALAKNGVLALQIGLSIAVIVTALSFVSDSQTNRPQKIMFIAVGVAVVFLIRLLADRIKSWTDRKFFREAYNSEQLLSELSEDVRTMVETKPLLETLSTRISESLHVPQVALLLKNGGSFQPAHALGYDTPPLASFANDARMIERLRKNEPVVIYQDDEESWQHEDANDRDKLRELNSQLLLPVGAKNQLSGLISLGPKLSEEPYSANDLRLLKSVASQTGLALENSRLTEAIATEAVLKERLNREIEIAREVQERLFPQELPKVEGLEYFGACRPASGVGGDYYDFFEQQSGKFGIAIGDVSGKGIGASLMMASLQASLRGQAIHSGDDLAGLMVNVNQLVYDTSTTNRYATFFYAQYEPSARKLMYVNAGHNPPFILRPSANGIEVILLTEGGPVVGMLPPMLVSYEQGEITLRPGDVLVGSTDGITEAMNPAEEEWGEDSMLEAVKPLIGRPAREILEQIVADADRFANGAKQHDDMTMIVINVV